MKRRLKALWEATKTAITIAVLVLFGSGLIWCFVEILHDPKFWRMCIVVSIPCVFLLIITAYVWRRENP
jgi:hypothetical protein